jgi:uncharacterized membrane protein YedE/YeeE
MRLLGSLLIGLVFGIGIAISGMANPAKVINFFDIAGIWDPSLAFVRGGALIVTFFGYKYVLKSPAPFLGTTFHLPTRRDLDVRLLGGSVVFGIGWGIAGFCPGGALPALGTGVTEVFVFVAAMLAGIFVAQAIQRRAKARPLTA